MSDRIVEFHQRRHDVHDPRADFLQETVFVCSVGRIFLGGGKGAIASSFGLPLIVKQDVQKVLTMN